MSALAQELKVQLANLSPEDRLELTFFLLDQLQQEDGPEWRAAWTEELHRRDCNPNYLPAEEVFDKYNSAEFSTREAPCGR